MDSRWSHTPSKNTLFLEVTPEYSIRQLLVACGSMSSVDVAGVLASHDYFDDLGLEQGRFLRQPDLESASPVAVIGSAIATRAPCLNLESVIVLGGINVKVIGILRPTATAGDPSSEGTVFVPASLLARRYGQGVRGGVRLAVTVRGDPEVAAISLRSVLTRLHPRSAPSDIVVVTSSDVQREFAKLASSVTQALFWLLAVSQLTAAIGLLNTIFVSVRQRTPEFGLRRAVGATRHTIALGILCESLLISSAGAVAGVVGGALIGMVVARFCGLPAFFNWGVALAAVGLSVVLSAAAGLAPAIRAANQSPVEALRYEG